MLGKASYNSVAYFGRQGAGKTLQMIKDAIRLACERRRGIVGNLWLKPEGFYRYGVKYKLDWLKRIADEGQIITLPSEADLDLLFRYPYSVVLFDEAGAKMFTRNFQSNSKNMIEQGVQLRKNYCTLLWSAQYETQTDKFLRATVERCCWCSGISKFDWRTQKDYLYWRSARYFNAREFWVWCDDERLRMHPVQTALKSIKHDSGMVDQRHKDLFNCFDSHSIIGTKIERPLQPIILNYRYRCDLPKYYYQTKIKETYDDPITRYRYEWREPQLSLETYLYTKAYYEDPFFQDIPKKQLATAYHFHGYFETEKPLPLYTGENPETTQKKSNARSKNRSNGKAKKREIDPRVLEFLSN